MSLQRFINNEIEISNFKLRSLSNTSRPYKSRLAEIEREFLQIDFEKIVNSELEAREATRLFRLSRPLFYKKYKNASSYVKDFSTLKESTINRKRFIFNKIKDLSEGKIGEYNDNISDFFSYSNIIKKRQIMRFICGSKSLGVHCELTMNKVYQDIKDLDESNILYAKSLVDTLIEDLYQNWYSNYNDILKKTSIKLKPLRVILNKKIESKDVYEDLYAIETNIKKVGNEHSKIVHLSLLDKNSNVINKHFLPNLCGVSSGSFKILKLNRSNEKGKAPKIYWVKLFTASTRSESISIDSLDQFVSSFCSSISQEYHLL